jgi:hypothetical protein
VSVTDVRGAVAKARRAIIEGGGTIDGDDERGTFAGDSPLGDIEGTYTTLADGIAVTITRKPFLIPCSLLRDKVRGYFS